MTRVLAAVDASAASGPVLYEAQLLADLFEAEPEAVYVGGQGRSASRIAAHVGMPIRVLHGDPETAILREAAADDVVLSVMGARRLLGTTYPIGHLTQGLIQRLPKLAVVVPPDYTPTKVGHVLVPLDGTRATGRAVADLVDRFAQRGTELVVLHTLTPDTMPTMLDHNGALQLWEEEFLRRACPELLDFPMYLCVGPPGAKVTEVARSEPTDLVVLAWRRNLSGHHGQVVLDTLAHAGVPVLLAPIISKASGSGVSLRG